MKKIFLPLLLLFFAFYGNSQSWLKDMYNPSVNFYTVQSEFNAWWQLNRLNILTDTAKGEKEHGEAWKIYKRWEQNVQPLFRAQNGNRLGAFNQAEADYYAQSKQQNSLRSAANWTYIGPQISFDDGTGDSSAGRLNCVRFDPNNPGVIYVGAPSGGIWKSPDFGRSWQLLNTDNLGQIGVSDIAINPQNSNTIYIATGDIANSACFSIGVLKSIDGGQTWNTTSLSWTVSQGFLIARLLMSPVDSNTMMAATNAGVFKTSDGGNTWTGDSTMTGLTGMEFNPLNPSTIYTWGYQLYKSVDGATTWRHLASGLPPETVSGGFAVGLTPADTSCVYVLVSDAQGFGAYLPFNGIYQSLNGGSSFTEKSTTPDPSMTGTQGLYDMTIAVSPTNENQLVIGAVENAFSSDGGTTWTSPNTDSHVDQHDIRFYPGSNDTVFSADDGGLFISTDQGNDWFGINNGIHIGQLYNVSSSAQTKYMYLTGRQDEGTLLQNSAVENIVDGGDGLECLIDPRNQNNMFFSTEYGNIDYSTNGGVTVNNLVGYFFTGVNGVGAWNTPYALDPASDQVIYVAKDYVYKSTDGGQNFNQLNSPPLPEIGMYPQLYLMMAIAPSNDQYIYAGTNYNLYASTDGGSSFTDISAGLDTPFYSIAVSDSNPAEIWVGTTGPHIFMSVNAGTTYSDYSAGLPLNTPFYVQTIAPIKNSLHGVYAGLFYAGGVYYRDTTMSQWVPFSTGLPNATVNQIEVDYFAGKIRAATYGRDLWESDPYVPVIPTAAATYTGTTNGCIDTVLFTDQSTNNPNSWQWFFPGAEPDTSAGENPTVVYPTHGHYTATLIATNSAGSDTVQYDVIITVCTGISNVSANGSMQIMPNPNNGNFIASLNSPVRGKVTFMIFNNIGQNVYQSSITKDADALTKEFDLSALSKGIYYVQVISEGNSSVQKLVIGN